MTTKLEQQMEALILAAQEQYQQDVTALMALLDAGLFSIEDYNKGVADARKLLDWNIGQAHIAFEVDK